MGLRSMGSTFHTSAMFRPMSSLTLSLMALGQLAQHFLMTKCHKKHSSKNLKKYLIMHNHLRNTFYFRQIFILLSFVPTIIEITKLALKVLDQIAQESLVL
jgi:hypothetical protein